MRIFITGGSGFIGSYLRDELSERGHEVIAPEHGQLDLTKDGMEESVLREKPQVIIHLAGIKDQKFCEDPKNYEVAYAINVTASKRLAEASNRLGCLFVFLSTDFVFDGKEGNYAEEDTPCPASVYGKLKLEVEEYLKKSCRRYLICRTSGVYGLYRGKESFIDYVLVNLAAGKKVVAYANIINCPTLVYDLCGFIGKILSNWESLANGIYHVCGDEKVSRLEFARKIAVVFEYNKSLVEEAKKEGFELQDTSLNNTRAKETLGFSPATIKRGLSILRGELNDKKA